MGMFSNLMSKIFGQSTTTASSAPAAAGPATATGSVMPSGPATADRPASASGPSVPVGSATPAGSSTGSGSASAGPATASPVVDVTAILDGLAAKNSEKLDWKKSIVDLLKLVGMDSSLGARKELATELGYSGDQSDSATMNVWLHKAVLKKLADNGGKVPADLLD